MCQAICQRTFLPRMVRPKPARVSLSFLIRSHLNTHFWFFGCRRNLNQACFVRRPMGGPDNLFFAASSDKLLFFSSSLGQRQPSDDFRSMQVQTFDAAISTRLIDFHSGNCEYRACWNPGICPKRQGKRRYQEISIPYSAVMVPCAAQLHDIPGGIRRDLRGGNLDRP